MFSRDLVFRLDETRASVTKYAFFLIKVSADRREGPFTKTVRTPTSQALFGEQKRNSQNSNPLCLKCRQGLDLGLEL